MAGAGLRRITRTSSGASSKKPKRPEPKRSSSPIAQQQCAPLLIADTRARSISALILAIRWTHCREVGWLWAKLGKYAGPMQLWIGRLVPTLFAAMLTALAIAGTPLVDYRAAASCPAREVFELELSRRLSTTGNFTGSLSIVIEQVDGSYLGRATWKNQVGPSAERFVHHEHCEKLVGALALIGALLLEQEPAPHETTKPVSPEELTAAPTPAAPSKAIAPPKAPAAWVTVVPREFKVTRPSPPAPHKQRTLANWFWGPSVGLTGDGLFAPTFRVGPRLGEVLTLRSTPRSSEFEIKVTAARLTSGTFDTAQGSASITWSSLRLDACYGREAYQGLTFGPCTSYDIGILTATSEVAPGPTGQRTCLPLQNWRVRCSGETREGAG